MSLPILIAGGGPAGLCAALCLHQRGFAVRVFEKVEDDVRARFRSRNGALHEADGACLVTADKESFWEPFRSWVFDWINVPAPIETAEAIYEHPLADRDPLPWWTKGRVTLLSDAAHPMHPVGSNGAVQGILDGEKLAELLAAARSQGRDPRLALQEYDASRRPATAAIVELNRQDGPDQVVELAESRAPRGFAHIHDIAGHKELAAIARRYKETSAATLEHANP